MRELTSASEWNKMWQEFRTANATVSGKKNDQGEFWDRRADSFANNTIKSRDTSRVDRVFGFLRGHGALDQNIRILDIGSGPGSFAIPFATLGNQVTALDPSRRMLDLFAQSVPDHLKDNIETIEGIWEDIDPVSRGWTGCYDLVFASMCPGINEQSLIEKMMICSRQWCYISAFSGPRHFEVYDEIFQTVAGHPYPNHFNDIIFHFNLIYALGYKPVIQFVESSFVQKETVENIQKEVYRLLPEATGKSESVIEEVIARHTIDGEVHQQVSSTVGMMLWRVK
ncbi:MAG: class I SAM-dependent methyltransferase [Syntrophomonadaceae bacterium]|nr:class I SAM-dependent methyltransferase [Syntrophomonadaceae bacterium]